LNPEPRIGPGRRREIGRLNALIAWAIGRATGTGPPNLFTTLARHRSLFRAWLRFAAKLMPRGTLPRADTELVILRVAHNTAAEYEWRHHERIAQSAGLSAAEVARVRLGPDADGWSERQAALLRAADELHERREISDQLWAQLAGELSDVELIELCMLVGHYEMLAMTLRSLRVQPDEAGSAPGPAARDAAGRGLAGRRVLITGAARGIGAATARRLHERGARIAVAGIEGDQLARVAADCGDALAVVCDVRDREQVDAAVEAAVEHLGGLDVVIANAGVAAQLPVVGGDPEIFERTLEVNLLGVYYTLRAAGPHIAHERGYALAVASLAAAVHPPLLGAYSASKAGVEALADALRIELGASGARVGVAYFGELETDMTRRGFGTEAAARLNAVRGPFVRVAPLRAGVDAIERGLMRRSRRVVAPGWVAWVLPVRMLAQRVVEAAVRRGVESAVEVARTEHAGLTTAQPEEGSAATVGDA
jgi:NAD(P)-dependent dehydrogenase (short-subunit alcohol dehydrogenase family)/alkylhydroperoxidase family enzyme